MAGSLITGNTGLSQCGIQVRGSERNIRHEDIEVREPFGKLHPVPNLNRTERFHLPEINVPPGIQLTRRVSHRIIRVYAIGVAIDGSTGNTRGLRTRLSGGFVERDISGRSSAQNLHFRKRQEICSGQLHAYVTTSAVDCQFCRKAALARSVVTGNSSLLIGVIDG